MTRCTEVESPLRQGMQLSSELRSTPSSQTREEGITLKLHCEQQRLPLANQETKTATIKSIKEHCAEGETQNISFNDAGGVKRVTGMGPAILLPYEQQILHHASIHNFEKAKPVLARSDTDEQKIIYVTNPEAFPIHGFYLQTTPLEDADSSKTFLSIEEEARLVAFLDSYHVANPTGSTAITSAAASSSTRKEGWMRCGFLTSQRQQRREQIFFRSAMNKSNCRPADHKEIINDDATFENNFGWLLDKVLATNQHSSTTVKDIQSKKVTCSNCKTSEKEKDWKSHLRYNSGIEVHAIDINGASPDTDLFEPRHEMCCALAEVSLLQFALMSAQRPAISNCNETWDLHSSTSYSKVLLPPRSVLWRSGEFLHQWRSHISTQHQHTYRDEDGVLVSGVKLPAALADLGVAYGNECGRLIRDEKYRRISLKIRFLCDASMTQEREKQQTPMPSLSMPKLEQKTEQFSLNDDGESHQDNNTTTISEVQLPLDQLLTIVVTTSPIKSNPSTEMFERVWSSFELGGHGFAFKCPKIIICDGIRIQEHKQQEEDNSNVSQGKGGTSPGGATMTQCDVSPSERNGKHTRPKVTRKHANFKQALRNGIATATQAENYKEFKKRLREMCDANRDNGKSPFVNTTVIELDERHGYGFALREAVKYHVKTKYMIVIQHDRIFMRSTPIEETIRAMEHDSTGKIKYVGMSMKSNFMYHDIFLSKYGRNAYDILCSMALRPKELLLLSSTYGSKGSAYEEIEQQVKNERVLKNIKTMRETYVGSQTYVEHEKLLKASSADVNDNNYNTMMGLTQLSLTPTLFWYDNTHICLTQHYREFVYNDRFRMVAKGGFVEDKLSPVIIRQVERLGLVKGHAQFGCYLLDDHSGYFFTGHMDGGSYMTQKQHADVVSQWKSHSASK
jgi:hypothetical protein